MGSQRAGHDSNNLAMSTHTYTVGYIYIYIYIYIYTIYTHLNIELKALEFVEIEDRMVVSRVWGNWEDVGQRVQT